jgi:hypothetical protein
MKSNSKREMPSFTFKLYLLSFQTRYSESELNTFLGISKKSPHAPRLLSNLIWREKLQEPQSGHVVEGERDKQKKKKKEEEEKTKAKAFMKVVDDLCEKRPLHDYL